MNITIPLSEISFSVARSSGPGGQNVNKVSSKVVLNWNVMTSTSISDEVRSRFLATFPTRINKDGSVTLSSDTFRDQPRNKEECIRKLEAMIQAASIVPKKRRKTKPSRSSSRKRLDSKKRHGEKKQTRGKIND